MSGKFLMLGVSGLELTSQEKDLFKRVQPGGYVLFGRNFASAKQVRELTDSLRELTYDEPILAVDQEGGRVSRTREIGIEPPSAQDLRDCDDPNLMATHGEITADLLRLLGFNLCLAPVLDISYNDNADNALRGRCWGRTSQEVIQNAGVYNRYMRKRKIQSCAKHFPSCGLATVDPHHLLPIVDKSLEDLIASDLMPYNALFDELDAVMTCHTHFSAIDPQEPGLPSSLSRNVVTGILRNRLGFNGLIMTDDLDMGAIINTYGRGPDVKAALEAGNDMALICHHTLTAEVALEAIHEVDASTLIDAEKRIKNFKKKMKAPIGFSEDKLRKIKIETMKLRVQVLGEAMASKHDPEVKNSPVEDY
jgi:beta-N-acetylhexosaminidase